MMPMFEFHNLHPPLLASTSLRATMRKTLILSWNPCSHLINTVLKYTLISLPAVYNQFCDMAERFERLEEGLKKVGVRDRGVVRDRGW